MRKDAKRIKDIDGLSQILLDLKPLQAQTEQGTKLKIVIFTILLTETRLQQAVLGTHQRLQLAMEQL